MINIWNPGSLDLNGLRLFGASTKGGQEGKIGQFGSGLKYALGWLLRNKVEFWIEVDGKPVVVETRRVFINEHAFDEILINGEPTSVTTNIGPKWLGWMAIRELYANALDEGGGMDPYDRAEWASFGKGYTQFVIKPTGHPELEDAAAWSEYYFGYNRAVIYENEFLKVYRSMGKGPGLYVKGILISSGVTQAVSGLGYELKKNPFILNEERNCFNMFNAYGQLCGAILTIDHPGLVQAINELVMNDDPKSLSLERIAFTEWSDYKDLMVGASRVTVKTSSDGRSYGYGYEGTAPENISQEWRKYTFLQPGTTVIPSGIKNISMMSSHITEMFNLTKFESVRWTASLKGDISVVGSDIFEEFKAIMPEMFIVEEDQIEMYVGTPHEHNVKCEIWKKDLWLSEALLDMDEGLSNKEIMVLIFMALMSRKQDMNEPMARMIIEERMKQPNHLITT